VVLLGLRFLLTAGLPIYLVSQASHDDKLYLEQGSSIAAGSWLGPYDDRTLLKGPMFSLFLAGLQKAGLSYQPACQLLHAAVCLLLLVALGPLVPNRALRWGIFLAVLFHPLSFGVQSMARLVRDGLYITLTLAVAACLLGWAARVRRDKGRAWPWALGAGLALGSLWITREEGPWILPLVGAVLLAAVWKPGPGQALKARLKRVSASLAAAFMGWTVVLAPVILVNKARYGFQGVVEYQSRELLSAYGALAAVRTEPFLPRIVISRAGRRQAYEVSPAFRELAPYLEGRIGRKWADISAGIYPDAGGEILGGWFIHALREAVAAAGHAGTAREALAFYDRIGREIRAAGRLGGLPLASAPRSMNPSWHRSYAPSLFKAWWKGWVVLCGLKDEEPLLPPSRGSGSDLAKAWSQTRTRPTGSGGLRRVVLFRVSASDRPVTLRIGSGERLIRASFRPVRAGARLGPGSLSGIQVPAGPPRGFIADFNGDFADAALLILDEGRLLQSFPLDGSAVAATTGPLRFRIDGEAWDWPSRQARREARQAAIRALQKAYVAGLALLALIATAILGWTALARRRILDPIPLILSLGMIMAAVLRVALLAWIDASSFPGIKLLYLAPAYPLLILGAGLILAIRTQRRA
jgi:hypothetical protein